MYAWSSLIAEYGSIGCKVANPARGQLNRYRGKNTSLSPFASENLVSRDDGFSRPVPCQPAQSPNSGWICCLLTGFLPISAAASIYLNRHTPLASPEFIGSCKYVTMELTAENPPVQGQ